METYGKILNLAIPVFLFLFLIEKFAEWRMGKQVIRGLDSVSSFSSGITNVVKDVLGISIQIITYQWLVERVAIVHIEATWLVFLIAFIAVDFQGYWVHRWSHEINFLWNRHVVHHSSEDFNLACALRQSISAFINYFTILLIPAALLGIPAHVIAIIAPLHLFLQYWYHTQLIGKLGFLEHIIVTPSHHRVHHAQNRVYMDKNHGQIFIIWDKLFGTFQEELDDVPPIYGITRPAQTWNPIVINFQHLWLMINDAWQTKSWWDKTRIWFMPTGWRPADVEARYPIHSIKDPYAFQKFDTNGSPSLIVWSWVQMLFNYFLLTYFFANIKYIGMPRIFIYGLFIYICIYAYTELMNKNRYAMYLELVKSLFGISLIYWWGDWFGSSSVWGWWHTYFIAIYLVISALVSSYFSIVIFPKENCYSDLKQSM